MIAELITTRSEAGHDLELRSMFEDRKRVFIDQCRWHIPALAGRYEIDQFDDPTCRYILLVDSDRQHLGSLRLLQTIRPHLLQTLFAQLCDGPVPTGSAVAEVTRLCLSPRLLPDQRRSVRNRLISELVDQALAAGIDTLTGVVTESFLTQVLAMGWNAGPLGPVRDVSGDRLGAFRIDLDAATPDHLATTGIYVPRAVRTARVAVAA